MLASFIVAGGGRLFGWEDDRRHGHNNNNITGHSNYCTEHREHTNNIEGSPRASVTRAEEEICKYQTIQDRCDKSIGKASVRLQGRIAPVSRGSGEPGKADGEQTIVDDEHDPILRRRNYMQIPGEDERRVSLGHLAPTPEMNHEITAGELEDQKHITQTRMMLPGRVASALVDATEDHAEQFGDEGEGDPDGVCTRHTMILTSSS